MVYDISRAQCVTENETNHSAQKRGVSSHIKHIPKGPHKYLTQNMDLFAMYILAAACWFTTASATHFTVTSQVYLDFSHNGKHIGRTTIGLFGDLAPRTVANFREICINGIDGQTYAGSPIHRIIDKFMVQGLKLIQIEFAEEIGRVLTHYISSVVQVVTSCLAMAMAR